MLFRFEFPMLLDVREFLCEDGERVENPKQDPPVYVLHSVLSHTEFRRGSGHYTAFIQTATSTACSDYVCMDAMRCSARSVRSA